MLDEIAMPKLLPVLLAALTACASAQRPPPAPAGAPIDELIPSTIGGVRQWLLLRGEDSNRPILLFLHGGPGSPLMPFSRTFDAELVRRFLVVHWDQRQAGKSFDPTVAGSTLQIPRYVDDCLEVLAYLHQRFPRNRILLVGHSWGSLLGLRVAAADPPGLLGYVGVGQMVDVARGEREAYDWAVARARENGAKALVAKLDALGPPPYPKAAGVFALSSAVAALGGVFARVTPQQLGHALQTSPDYTSEDRERKGQGEVASLGALKESIESFRALDAVPSLPVPVWFVEGAEDHVCPPDLLAEYEAKLTDRRGKHLVTMPGTGHFPFWDDPSGFARVLDQIVEQAGGR